MADFVISNDLVVLGMSTFTGGQTFDGQMIVDLTNTEALLVRQNGDSGDVFIVDTTNEIVKLAQDDTILAFGAASDAQMHRGDGADIIEQRRGANAQAWNIYDNFVSTSDYDRLSVYIGGGPPVITAEIAAETTDGSQRIDMVLESAGSDSNMTFRVGSTNDIRLVSAGIPTMRFTPTESWDIGLSTTVQPRDLHLSRRLAIGLTSTSAVPDAIRLGPTSIGGAGTRDSHGIEWTGRSNDGSEHEADWRAFVTPITNAGDSLFRWQNRIDGVGFTDVIRYDNEGRFCVCQPHQVSIGSFNFIDNAHLNITGAFVDDYGGGPTSTHKILVDGSVEGDATRTVALNVAQFSSSVITQTATENIANISQVQIDEPNITDNLTGDITNAQSLLITGSPTEGESNFSIRSLGSAPVQFAGSMIAQGASGHAFGGPATNSVLTIDTTSTADGGGTNAAAVNFFPDYTGASGLTEFIALTVLAGNIQTQAVAETTTNVSTLVVREPSITIGAGHTVTNAQTILIDGAPTEGTNNYALRITAGHILIPSENDANTPTLAFGDGDTGFYEQADDQIQVAIAGGATMRFASTAMRSTTSGSWQLSHAAAGATVPVYQFQGDTNTGMGKAAADQLSLIVGGVEVLRLSQATAFTQSLFSGAFVSDGSSNLVTGAAFGSDITNASGDVAMSQVRMGTTVGGSLTTSGAGDSIFAATLWLDEPDITLTAGDAMATAATLYISNAPTEGTSANYALFIDNGASRFDGGVQMAANSTFSNPANTFTFGSGVAQTHAHVAIIGAFTSSGISNHAEHLFVGGTLTGANGDTESLAGVRFSDVVVTQGNTEVIADVAQLYLSEPNITVGTGDTITNAQTLLIVAAPTEGTNNYALRVAAGDVLLGGNLAVSGAGPHAIAGTPSGIIGLIISDTFTSDGSGTLASGIFTSQTLVGASGDTTSLTGTTFSSAITTQTATETITNISQVEINEPFITDNLTGDITNAQTLLIVAAPTEGVNNYALRVAAGATLLGGELETTAGRIKTVTRVTTTYTILVTDSVVFGNTDSAGFTATLPAGVSGQTLKVVNSGSSGNNLTVAPDGSDDLLGANSSFTLFDGESLDITFDSTDGWY